MMKDTTHYYTFSSMIQFKNLAETYWDDHQSRLAKEYYLRAMHLANTMNQDEILYFLKDNCFGQLLVFEKNYKGMKEYYQWIIDHMEGYQFDEGYLINAYVKMANLSMIEGNIEKMNDYYLKACEAIGQALFPDNSVFVEEEILSRSSINPNMIIEVMLYGKDLIEKKYGKESEEYFYITARLASYLSHDQECIPLYNEAIECLKKCKGPTDTEEFLRGIISNKPEDQELNYIDQFYPQLLDVMEKNRDEYDLEVAYGYTIYARNILFYSQGRKNNQRVSELNNHALSVFEFYYGLGSPDLSNQVTAVLEDYSIHGKKTLYNQLYKSYKKRLIQEFGIRSEEYKYFLRAVQEAIMEDE